MKLKNSNLVNNNKQFEKVYLLFTFLLNLKIFLKLGDRKCKFFRDATDANLVGH